MPKAREKTKVERDRFASMLDELKRDGITQCGFARAVGITQGFVSRLRTGNAVMSVQLAKDIESAFPKYHASWLLGIDVDQSSKADALHTLDPRVSSMSQERRDALLECVKDFIDFSISKNRF